MVIEYTSAEINAAVIQFLAGVKEARLFAFHGEMGAGKTTFINAICSALKVKDAVCSPTFSIINEYKTSLGEKVFHIDLYRLKNEKEALLKKQKLNQQGYDINNPVYVIYYII